MSRVARWVGVVGVGVLALGAARTGAQNATYNWQISNGATIAGITTNWTATCATTTYPSTAMITTMTTAAFGCASTRLYDGRSGGNDVMLTMVRDTIYSTTGSTQVTGFDFIASLRNGTSTATISVDFQIGYVSGGVFTGFGTPVAQSFGDIQTTYTIGLTGQSGTVPANAVLALRVRKVTATTDVARIYLGSTPGPNSGRLRVTETAVPSNAIQLVTGTNPAGNTAVCPGDTVNADQFGFTVTGAADRVSALTVSGLQATTPLAAIAVSTDAGATITSLAPTGNTQAFSWAATDLAAPVGTTYYRLHFTAKSHAVLGASVPAAVTPIVLDTYTATNTKTAGSDTANAFTIDNTAQANVAASSTNTPTSSSLTLSLGASAGLTEYVVWAQKTSVPADNPVDGTQYTVQAVSATASWIAYVGAGATPTISGLDASSTYNFRIFARDVCFNYSTTAATASGTTSAPPATTTVGNGTNPTAAPTLAPGGAATMLDAFSLQTSAGTETVSGATVTLAPANAFNNVGLVEITDSTGATVYGSASNPASNTVAISPFTTNITATATLTEYRVRTTPKSHAAMPAPATGASYATTGTVTAITSANAKTYSDAGSDTVTIDNQSPAAPTGLAGAAGSSQAVVSWTGEPADADFLTGGKVVVLGKIGSAPADVPVEGTDYVTSGPTVTVGTSFVACFAAPGAKTCTASGLTPSSSYYFVAFARDSRLNHSVASLSAGPVVPTAFIGDGDTTPNSVRPVISIIDPMNGAVLTLPAKIQIRAFIPAAGGNFSPAETVTLLRNGVPVTLGSASKSANYSPVAGKSGVWEHTIQVGDFAAGATVTLRAWAANSLDTTPTYSGTITVTIVASGMRGDGNLLVRDNSSQLCGDCHAGAMSHTSESTGNKWGSWATTCRDCHTPHSTTNLSLVKTQIKPPELTAATTPQAVTFWNKSGFAANSYAQSGVGAGNTGVCEVCHTRTDYYQADGTPAQGTHEIGPCNSCHKHTKGLAASCTECHGDNSATPRATFAGGDSQQLSAPPLVATPTPTGAVTGGGAHVRHVSYATYRTNPLFCADCHLTKVHIDGKADVAWGALATSNATTPTPATGAVALAGWPTTPSCTNWCHGAGMPDGGATVPTPAWNGAAFAGACNKCHGSPPPVNVTGGDHPQNATCSSCHGTGYSSTAVDAAAKLTHVDGTIQKPNNGCTACHGVLAGPAPAAAVANTSATSSPGYDATAVDAQGATTGVYVGAHQAHVNPAGHSASPLMGAKGCAVCHPLPLDATTAHADNLIQFSWSSPANAGAVSPTPTASITKPSAVASSCTNYCHSNARPLGGTLATPSFAWDSATAMTCTSCHQTATFGGTGLSLRHSKHRTNYTFTCDECHTATMADNTTTGIGTPANHVEGNKNVTFSATAVAAAIDQSGGNYTSTVTTPNYTCASTYCHSGGVSTTPGAFSATASAAIAWNAASTTTCQTCHGWTAAVAPTIGVALGSSFQGSAAHMNHVANAGVIGTNYVCGACHKNTVAATTDSPITAGGYANHVNGVKDVSIADRGTIVSTEIYLAGSCDTTYCHSSGQRAFAFRTIAWGGAAIGCNGCHGQSTGTGAPDYANGGVNTTTSNSHSAHVGSSADCAICHNGFVTSAGTAINGSSHTNGAINVAFDTAVAGTVTYVAGAATPTSATCANVKCHGNNVTPVVWGGPSQTCTSCHGTTGVETTDLGATFWSNGIAATINTTEWSYSGHGRPTASGAYVVTGNPAAAFPTAPTAGTSECMYCHDSGVSHKVTTNPFRLRGVTDVNGVSAAYAVTTSDLANAVCLNCHSATANGVDPDGTVASYTKKVATLKTPNSHEGAKHSLGTLGGKFCWDCHDPHGDSTTTAGPIAMIANSVTAVSDGTYGYVGASGVQRAVTFNNEAGSPPAVGKVVEGVNAGTQRVGVCQACHAATSDTLLASSAWTKYWNRLGYDDPDGVGGTVPAGSTHNAGSTATPYCISCHTHATGFGGECIGCHATTQPITQGPLAGTGNRRDVVTEFKQTWSHKASTNTVPASRTVSNADCVVCHMEGNSPTDATPSAVHGDGLINLRDPDTGLNIKGVTWSVVSPETGAGSYKSTGTDAAPARFSRDLTANAVEADVAAIQINQCLKCHDSNGALSASAQVPTTGTAGKPFGTTIAGNGYLASTALTACLGAPPAWSATVTYSYGMWVSVSGVYYEATNLAANLNKPPASNPTFWTAAAAYSATTTYPSGDWVTVGGIFYRSLQSGNLNNAPASSPTWWQVQNPVDGCVTNVAASFATSNSSYHPISGKQNNSYASGTRMAIPWNMTKTAGTTTSWGYLMSCWDCHALPTDSGIITKTITAHGGTDTIRGTAFGSGASNPATQTATLCIKCHALYDTLSGSNHGAGSAFSSSGNSGMQSALRNGCSMCHGGFWSGTAGTTQVRPLRAEDVHGFDALPAGGNVGTRKTRWLGTATGTPLTVNTRPYGFIRNTYVIGQHTPKSAVVDGTAVVYTSAGCSNPTTQAANGCGSMSTYTVGGVY